MKGTLRLENGGWSLEKSDGNEVDSGKYPLVQNDEFIESAAEKLDFYRYHNTPYRVLDERDGPD